jgi:hypothetical protein
MGKTGTYGASNVTKMAKLLHKNVIMVKNWQKVYMRS